MKNLAAAVLALVGSLFAASCLQGQEPESPAEPAGPEGSNAAEPTEETPEPLPWVSYSPKDFPFVTTIKDTGEGKAGGWQVAHATLEFWSVVIPHLPRHWSCPLTVEMPLRTKLAGRISPSYAANISAEVAEDTARAMDYKLPRGIFCIKFEEATLALFRSRYPHVGARVTS